MGIRTGQQYLDKLNAMTPHVVIDGEVVSEKVAEHPAFRNVARSYARLFDMQHVPQYQDALTYTSPTSGDLVGAVADREIVDAAMRRLDESSRAIVVLHYFLGMPLTDVAATLGIPLGTVKSRLHRALGEMRDAVETEPPSPSPIPGGQVA